MLSLMRFLDRHRLFSLVIWEFCFFSLFKEYGRIFIWELVLKHPVRVIKGLINYWHYSKNADWQQTIQTMGASSSRIDYDDKIKTLKNESFVAVSFCQKPIGPSECPAGRFNHQCKMLPYKDLLSIGENHLNNPCNHCDIRAIGTSALKAGASVYIMTSAADIARHLFVPAINNRQFRQGIFLLCPYSIPAMILPLFICGIQATLIGFSEGACRDYSEFIRADIGNKMSRTKINPDSNRLLSSILENMAEEKIKSKEYTCFQLENFVYVPKP